MTTIIAKNKREFDGLVKEYRANAYMIITFGSKLVELEKGSELVVIKR